MMGEHAGLQKVSALAGLAHSSLGPCKSYKLLLEERSGEAALACSCLRLLEALEPGGAGGGAVGGAVGQLVSEAVRAHHAAYGAGAGCLLFMAGAWSRAALEALRRGVPAPRLVRTLSEGLDVCLRACRRHSVRVELVNMPPAPARPGSIRLSHSRHFSGASVAPAARSVGDVGPTARALSHGHARSMELVLQAGRLQQGAESGGCCPALDLGRLVTCVIPGPSEDQACVLPGCVLRLPAERAALAQRLRGRPLRAVLLTGDLCVRYRHLGSKRPPGRSRVADRLDPGGAGGGEEARWTDGVLAALRRLGVELVLVSGAAGPALGPPCLAGGVLLVERVRPPVLRALAAAAGAVPVAYASQLSQRCVGTGVTVTPWRELGDHQAVCVSTGGAPGGVATGGAPGGVATAVLTSCVPARLQALEDGFWACAHRLRRALQDGALLPGGGRIEMLCARDLREHARRGGAEPEGAAAGGGLYRDTVLTLMAEALTDYVATVTANGGLISKLQARREVEREVERLGGRGGVSGGVGGVSGGVGGVSGGLGVGGVSGGLGGVSGGLGEVSGGLGGVSGGVGGASGGVGGASCGVGGASGGAEQGRVYDNLSVKVEAWRRAMDLVLLVVQTDAEVVTGVDPDSLRTETNVVLL